MTFSGTQIDVRRDGEQLWASCPEPECNGWTAGSDSWETLFDMIVEWHSRMGPPTHGWWAIEPPVFALSEPAEAGQKETS